MGYRNQAVQLLCKNGEVSEVLGSLCQKQTQTSAVPVEDVEVAERDDSVFRVGTDD